MSIAVNLIKLAADEGRETALREAEGLVGALETICECGSVDEVKAASFLLSNVVQAVHDIEAGTLVAVARLREVEEGTARKSQEEG